MTLKITSSDSNVVFDISVSSSPIVSLAPQLFTISPNTGSLIGGTEIIITGLNLKSPSLLQLDGYMGSFNITILTNNGSTITGITNQSDIIGLVNLVITTPHGTNTMAGAFSYII
jgi:hypothetical protein